MENQQVNEALTVALKNLLKEIQKNGQLEEHHRKVSQAKIYDRLEKKYLEKENLKKDLGADYESSGSDSEQQNEYKGLNHNQIKYFIRKKLIKKKFNEKFLQEIILYTPRQQDDNGQQQQDSSMEINEINELENGQDGLKIINEANQILMKDMQEEHNLFALKFLINELQKIQSSS